jgi:ubiquinone/menaquinone biosynthesis C-methylase UbiE
MKDIEYIKDYYNKYYTDKLQSLFNKTLILQAFKPYENDKKQGKWLSKQIGIKGNEKILECGCGVGGVIKQIASLHPDTDIHGINISDGQVKMANEVLKDFKNTSISIQDFTNTNYDDNTFDIVYFCESMGYSNFEKTIKEAVRILKPEGKLYINEIVIKCDKDKLSKKELDKLNYFIDSWFYNVFDIQTIINKMNTFDKMELIYNSKFVKPSIHWINAVRNSELKKYHNSKLSNIPPIRGADFLYKKYK